MPRGKFNPMTVANILRGVKPRNTAKWLEAELGVTRRQSWRIVQTGRAPSYLRPKLLRLLDVTIAAGRAELERLENELRQITYQEMVDRARDRRAALHAAMSDGDPRSAAGPVHASLTDLRNGEGS